MTHDLFIIDDLHPEDSAMVQALYSRSALSAREHLTKVRATGSGQFMSQFYVGYGHKSIADVASTTAFIENVSILAAKAIQDHPLYCGQETSTRYLDFAARPRVDPFGTPASARILDAWMGFYQDNVAAVAAHVRAQHPRVDGEDNVAYDRAVKARTFDIMRAFLPAGVTTQLSWHSNLRQAGDKLATLRHHPAAEIGAVAAGLAAALAERYPASGFATTTATVSGVRGDTAQLDAWHAYVATHYSYQAPSQQPRGEEVIAASSIDPATLDYYGELFARRPRGGGLPHFLTDLGQVKFTFLLDFGSWRDIQRQRNGVCRVPILSTMHGFEPWYLEQLPPDLVDAAVRLIARQGQAVEELPPDYVARQYYVPLGFRVPTQLTYGLPATVYVLELRTGKMVHPTLRRKMLAAATKFEARFPQVPLFIDRDPVDWDVRRGTQTITERT